MNSSATDVADVPSGEETVTSTTPVPAGATAVIWVLELTVKVAVAVLLKSTAVASAKPVPVIVTLVPPATAPRVVLRPVTVRALPATVIATVAGALVLTPSDTVKVKLSAPK